jgi:hypothetical protein
MKSGFCAQKGNGTTHADTIPERFRVNTYWAEDRHIGLLVQLLEAGTTAGILPNVPWLDAWNNPKDHIDAVREALAELSGPTRYKLLAANGLGETGRAPLLLQMTRAAIEFCFALIEPNATEKSLSAALIAANTAALEVLRRTSPDCIVPTLKDLLPQETTNADVQ